MYPKHSWNDDCKCADSVKISNYNIMKSNNCPFPLTEGSPRTSSAVQKGTGLPLCFLFLARDIPRGQPLAAAGGRRPLCQCGGRELLTAQWEPEYGSSCPPLPQPRCLRTKTQPLMQKPHVPTYSGQDWPSFLSLWPLSAGPAANAKVTVAVPRALTGSSSAYLGSGGPTPGPRRRPH